MPGIRKSMQTNQTSQSRKTKRAKSPKHPADPSKQSKQDNPINSYQPWRAPAPERPMNRPSSMNMNREDEEAGHIFRPKVLSVVEFGHKGSEWDSVYPSKKELKLLPLGQKI